MTLNNFQGIPRRIKGKRVLLLGGAGFIGHNLALALADEGAECFVVDGLAVNNLLYFQSANYQGSGRDLYLGFIQERLDLLKQAKIPVFVEDVRDYFRLAKIFNDLRPEVVIHLAAVSHADRSNKDPYSTFDHSMRTLENALDSSKGVVEHFVFFSSSMVYGNFLSGIVDESTQCNPLGIYGALKYGGEKLVEAYGQVFKLPYTIVRPSALYGERCVSRRVAQIFIENATQGKEIVVKGGGDERLDFTYIGDLVQGVKKILTSEKAFNEIFNLTYGSGRSLRELVEIVSSQFPNVEIRLEERDHLMPERGTLCVEKAKNMLGYDPSFPLEMGLARYIEWYKEK